VMSWTWGGWDGDGTSFDIPENFAKSFIIGAILQI